MAATNFILVDPALTAQTAVDSSITEAGGSILVNTNKVTIATASGNTAIAGTLSAGASTLASAAVTGNLAVNTNKFSVAAATGNTVVAGTLGVTGAGTVGGALTVTGKTTGTTGALTGLGNYADQAAAVADGLGNGDLYHIDGVVMVVYGE